MAKRKSEDRPPKEALNSGDVLEEMRLHYEGLTNTQKRIAEYIIEQPQVVAFSTVEQMAARIHVNASTIVRFAYRHGLKGFPDLQERMRELVREQLSRAGDPNDGERAGHLEGKSFGASLSHDWQNLHRTIAGLDPSALGSAVDLLARARRVYLVAGFFAFPVAHYCAVALGNLLDSISLVASHDALAMSALAQMTPDDCALAFSFPPYATATHSILVWAKESGAKVIAVTDSPLSAVGKISDVVFLAASAGTEVQNSMVAPLALANALVNGVSALKGAPAWDLQEPSPSEG
jgi:DNA-binding MurR/RpiR family transcriptional regulator